jgi:hypothetical protein
LEGLVDRLEKNGNGSATIDDALLAKILGGVPTDRR